MVSDRRGTGRTEPYSVGRNGDQAPDGAATPLRQYGTGAARRPGRAISLGALLVLRMRPAIFPAALRHDPSQDDREAPHDRSYNTPPGKQGQRK
jgi:hypothetical protein